MLVSDDHVCVCVNEGRMSVGRTCSGFMGSLMSILSNKAFTLVSFAGGISLELKMHMSRGTFSCTWHDPFSQKVRSLRIVRRALRMLLEALKASSKKAMVAVGRYESVKRTYASFCSSRTLRGPKSSSGVVNRFSCREKVKARSSPSSSRISRTQSDSKDFPIPDGPSRRTCCWLKRERSKSLSSRSLPQTLLLTLVSKASSLDRTSAMKAPIASSSSSSSVVNPGDPLVVHSEEEENRFFARKDSIRVLARALAADAARRTLRSSSSSSSRSASAGASFSSTEPLPCSLRRLNSMMTSLSLGVAEDGEDDGGVHLILGDLSRVRGRRAPGAQVPRRAEETARLILFPF